MTTNEQQAKEGTTETKAQTNSNVGVQPQAMDIVKQANEAREGLRQEREAVEKALNELRELRAIQILGGTSSAGQQSIKKDELSPQDYAKRVLEGKVPKP